MLLSLYRSSNSITKAIVVALSHTKKAKAKSRGKLIAFSSKSKEVELLLLFSSLKSAKSIQEKKQRIDTQTEALALKDLILLLHYLTK